MTPRRKRMVLVGLVVLGVSVAAALGLRAFQENLLYFYSPTAVVSGDVPIDKKFRLGGLVVNGSVRRETGSLTVQFTLTDTINVVDVNYTGILPDLFREGQGIVTHGKMDGNGKFVADEVLAKHDENYMPPEVAASLAEAHRKSIEKKMKQQAESASE
ncbi:MAG: cytochrome c maturation protein CcmE [Gammaproteobacteria bacterium]